jgi:hypothetical protein
MAVPLTELNSKQQQKITAYYSKLFNEACNQLSKHMDSLDVAELYIEELPTEMHRSWCIIWDFLNIERTQQTVEFNFNKQAYWLTR